MKTGTTPEVDEGLSQGEILGAMPIIWQGMVHLRDGLGRVQTKLAYIFKNGDTYFVKGDAQFVPAQTWAKKALSTHLKVVTSNSDKFIDDFFEVGEEVVKEKRGRK